MMNQFDGRSEPKMRSITIDLFKRNPDKQVLLATMKTGGVGLNLVMACRVIIFGKFMLSTCLSKQDQRFCKSR